MSTLSADSIAHNDLLGRNKFASQIVKSLVKAYSNQKESLVVGIAGRWGSGKTTLLSLIEKELSSSYSDFPDQYKVIKFNPWAYSEISPEEIHRQFLQAIVNGLKKVNWLTKANRLNKIIKRHLKFLSRFKVIAK